MGICGSAPASTTAEVPKEDVKKHRQLDEALKTAHHQEVAVNKLLLLGAGESGKSTLFKQMITLYGKGFTEKDRKAYIPIIFRNVIASIEELCKQSVELPTIDPVYADCKISIAAEPSLKFINEMKYEDGTMTAEIVQHVKTLWKDPGIQHTYLHRSRYQLNDSAKFFLDNLDRVAAPSFLPTEDDMLRARVRTTGLVENDFVIENNKFKMFDGGGQRNERKKWIHCFEGVTAVLFVAAISEYDQVLYEDENVNRLDEALNLFENICNSRWFRDTSIILFLNKKDLFAEKLKSVPLTHTFPDFSGGDDFDAACRFIEKEFMQRNHQKKPIYCHVTCATDKGNVAVVFNGVKDIVVRGALETAGLV